MLGKSFWIQKRLKNVDEEFSSPDCAFKRSWIQKDFPDITNACVWIEDEYSTVAEQMTHVLYIMSTCMYVHVCKIPEGKYSRTSLRQTLLRQIYA